MRPSSPNSKKEVVLKRGPWTDEEDRLLTAYIKKHGYGSWTSLPHKAGLQRCGKSCRLRWINYLRPDIKRGKFSLQEEQTIIQLHALLGNRWSAMAAHLPKRTDNEIKNHWNTHLKKRLIKMGIDPMTHKPRTHASTSPAGKKGSDLSHMAQWENVRLEAEARLVRDKPKSTHTNQQPVLLPQQLTRPTPNQLTRTKPRCLDVLKAWQDVVAGMFAFPSNRLVGSDNKTSAAEELHDDDDDDDAWFENYENIVPSNIPNIMEEGLSDDFILNSWMGFEKSTEQSCDGNTIMEMMNSSSNCWDSVLNASPCGSPVFG